MASDIERRRFLSCFTFQQTNGYDGFGWYYWETEYPEEGSVGIFASRAEAEMNALLSSIHEMGGYDHGQ